MTSRQRIATACVTAVTIIAIIIDDVADIRWLGFFVGAGILTMALIPMFAPFEQSNSTDAPGPRDDAQGVR